jgi:hypothetical protein
MGPEQAGPKNYPCEGLRAWEDQEFDDPHFSGAWRWQYSLGRLVRRSVLRRVISGWTVVGSLRLHA